jgi:tRNA-Thr(GGU) m(6)t(6)A37 methyltransferase TsaA
MTQSLVVEPIGTVHTRYHAKYSAPRQPRHTIDATDETREQEEHTALVRLFPKRNFEQALDDLQGFERIWLVSWFDHNSTWKPKVLTPRGRTKRGVFATRSPHRPNPLGISVVRLYGVRGLELQIGHCDLLDNTPVLDIKPYIPAYDAFEQAGTGWLGEHERTARSYTLVLESLAAEQFAWLRKRVQNHGVDVEAYVREVLAQDPFPHPYRRIKPHCDGRRGHFTLAVRGWRIDYTCQEATKVVSIESVRTVVGKCTSLDGTLDGGSRQHVSVLEHAEYEAFSQMFATAGG